MKNIMPPINTPDKSFHDGNPATGEQGTIVSAEWLNNAQGSIRNTQQELVSVLTEAGIAIDENKTNQLLLAILNLITDRSPDLPVASTLQKGIVQLSSAITSTSEVLAATPKAVRAVDVASLKIANNLSEIKDAGLVAVAQTLLNLGLGEGSALPVGVPVPWPSATPPTGWLKCNGAAFTASQYPKLALAYPALRLPDLRGEFIRGWDDTRGVNPGRKLLSPEGDAFLDHDHEIITRGPGEGNFVSPLNEQGVTSDGDNYLIGAGIYRTYKASRSGDYRTASETRPRNVAFNYIVRAV